MHPYEELKAENWYELDNFTNYVNAKIADIEKAIKAEAERFGQPEYADEDFCYKCWKDCLARDMMFGASIALSFYARMFAIRMLKDMIGQPCYTERDKEICKFYLSEENRKRHEISGRGFTHLRWENNTEIDVKFELPKTRWGGNQVATYRTLFRSTLSHYTTLCGLGARSRCNIFGDRNLYTWTIRPFEETVEHRFPSEIVKSIRSSEKMRLARNKASEKYRKAHVFVVSRLTGKRTSKFESDCIRVKGRGGRRGFRYIIKSEATPEELAMAI